ncbi:immunoglobulin-binding protein [Anaeramoeba ignava]|uniref:Immunoglobulin-binding protein n=1 Tax=Anaeramoeba ignava TaxID=1746090 RepID=A0A9Q0RBW3_ANAIG|nr:immunoglobulin-binding protein [Anaeramoeba ignava]
MQKINSLPSLFFSAEKMAQEIIDGPNDQKKSFECIKLFEEISVRIRRESLFSPNETVDDVQTGYLKYLLTPYYLAQLKQQIMANRYQMCKEAKILNQSFIEKCIELDIIDDEDKKLFHKKKLTETQKRETKIAIFKKKKALEGQLKQLESHINLTNIQSNDNSEKKNYISNSETQNIDEIDLDKDVEDIQRRYYILKIKFLFQKAIEDISLIEQEIQMLEFMQKNSEKIEKEKESKNYDPKNSMSNDPQKKPFILHIPNENRAKEIQRDMFKPYVKMGRPMTEKEFQEELIQDGVYAQKQEKPTPKLDADDEKEADEALYQAREWDDFKDANPTGWGNRMTRF